MKINCYIFKKDSNIHNTGVFAKRRIPKGTFLIDYTGEKVDKLESMKREQATIHKSKLENNGAIYMFELDDKSDIDGNVSYNHARHINHSCDPNCEVHYLNGKIWIVAKRNIRKGEEISYNYCFDLETYKNHPCKCNSKNCVGYILDERLWRKIKISP